MSAAALVPEGSDFPLSNLPLGSFETASLGRRVGIRLGESILDCQALTRDGHLDGAWALGGSEQVINAHLALGAPAWAAVRAAVQRLLAPDSPVMRDLDAFYSKYLVPTLDATMRMPVTVGDYTDFYLSLEHARNVGTMFRGAAQALMDNWTCLPVAYHGRASTVVVSGQADPIRPWGQVAKPDAGVAPVFQPSAQLDYELELGYIFGGPSNAVGEPISLAEAEARVFGAVIVNDWSARDHQAWEYRPLGPFNGKNFLTTISPWVVPMAALQHARCPPPPRVDGAHPTLPYLTTPAGCNRAVDVEMEVAITRRDWPRGTEALLTKGNAKLLYWSVAQQVTHHSAGGCSLQPGDLLATGTISGPTAETRGSMLERSWRGTQPIPMPDGSTRCFLHDGDTVVMRAAARGAGGERIGFGECVGTVLPALEPREGW